MKFYVINRGDEQSIQLTKTFSVLAQQHGFQWDEHQPDLVVSIGGDGTMLHAFHQFVDQLEHVAFVGVHTGHLGFYADWKSDEIEKLVDTMAENGDHFEQKVVKYPLLDVCIDAGGEQTSLLALNECTLRGITLTLVARLDINDETFEMFRGDGICISTPSGSTAYNKSLGGAMLHPSLEAIQIAEIASINNRVYRTIGSPMILPKHHHCDIYPKKNRKVLLSVDHIQYDYEQIHSIRYKVSEKKVRFMRYRPFPFWNRVKDAFITP